MRSHDGDCEGGPLPGSEVVSGFLAGPGNRNPGPDQAMKRASTSITESLRTDPVTVYVSIGNSDDKLTQARWSAFYQQVEIIIRDRARRMYGVWLSCPAAEYQNACIAFGVDADDAVFLKDQLRDLAARFGQDSIAWAEAPETLFISPAEVLAA